MADRHELSIATVLFIVSLFTVIISIIIWFFIRLKLLNEIFQKFWNLLTADWLFSAIVIIVFILIIWSISNRKEPRIIRELFWEKCPPIWMIRILKFWGFWHNCYQFIKYHFWFRWKYRTLFVFSAVILIGLQAVVHYFNKPITNLLELFPLETIFSFDELFKIIGIYLLLLITYSLLKFRSVLVIDEFDDDTGISEASEGKGIVSILLVEMNRINQLYTDVNEQRPIASSVGEARQISAVLKVDDPGEMLSNAVKSVSTIALGTASFQVGSFGSIFNWIARGPRIRGSIRRGEHGIILLATMTGPNISYGWKVTSTINPDLVNTVPLDNGDENETPSNPERSSEKQPKPVNCASDKKQRCIDEMVKELACRIFTDVPSTGTFKWDALYHFNEGLRKYRECLRTPKDQTANFKEAEIHFQKALTHDTKFTTAWYNLGIIYSELGQKKAAETAFLKVIEQDANQPGAYYALALTRFCRYWWRLSNQAIKDRSEMNNLNSTVLSNCEQVCALHRNLERPLERFKYRLIGWVFPDYLPLQAKNYNLMGLTYQKLLEQDSQCYNSCSNLNKSIIYHKWAVIAAWKNYSRINRYGIGSDYNTRRKWEESCRLLATCISDLGWIHLRIYHHLGKNQRLKCGVTQNVALTIAGPLFNAAIGLNTLINSDCTCAEVHWRRGIHDLCKAIPGTDKTKNEKIYQRAYDDLKTALRIHPQTLKYHITLTVASDLYSGVDRHRPFYCMKNALPFAIQSYKDEKERKDHQWNSLDRVWELLGCIPTSNANANNSCYTYKCYFTLKSFVKEFYELDRMLDFYPTSFESGNYIDVDGSDEIKNKKEIIKKIDQKFADLKTISGSTEPYTQPDSIQCPSIREWINGYWHFAQGRLNYYQAVEKKLGYSPEIVKEFSKSQKEFHTACSCFQEIPDERIKVYSRLALVQAKSPSHDFEHAFCNSTVAHLLNPIGDYEHITQGFIALSINDFMSVVQYNDEALRWTYDIPKYPQYIFKEYYRQVFFSLFGQALSASDEACKNQYRNQCVAMLQKALQIFESEYEKSLRADEELENLSGSERLRRDYESSEILNQTMIIRALMGLTYSHMKRMSDAVNQYQIVNFFYQPQCCGRILYSYKGDSIKTKNLQKCSDKAVPYIREYIISLLLIGVEYYNNKKFSDAQRYFKRIIGYKNLIDSSSNVWYNLGFIITSQEILLRAYLNTMRISVDRNINDSFFIEYDKEIHHQITNLKKLMEKPLVDAELCLDLDTQYRTYMAEFYKIRGLIALKFQILLPADNLNQNVNALVPIDPDIAQVHLSNTTHIDRAIECFKYAIIQQANSESYVFLLKAIEKLVDKCEKEISEINNSEKTNPVNDDDIQGTTSSDENKIREFEKIKEIYISEAIDYCEALKKLGVPEEHQEFFEEFLKKLRKSKDSEKEKNIPAKNS